ncbi:polysaccharide deacetylase family protein [Winogradskyella ouciana]|uniref:Polysaccharide deacetylase family protein n=1 Tax=Winogradskyella ouciana TaxID=2608631 RepID=A0A7K1G925_9FLAO|nr:polysaccharide deacetylase family protein [Winogradskyella ouciana]MTE25782.1 polysaccharide deacetylase family protein [Winogradskyella ouciana]
MTRNVLIIITFISLFVSCHQPPNFIGFTYPDGNTKALILSYDDGTIQDIELAALFDKNHLIGTFNLNSKYLGVTRGWPQQDGDTIYQRYVPKDSLLIIYKNHEIAAHGALHKNFTAISKEEILEEINTDLEVLEKLTNRNIISMAYPFGSTNDSIANLIASTGIKNGRTVDDTHTFDLPNNYMIWHPTCHDSKALDYLDSYLELDRQQLSVFYVWGHSWEFGNKERWDNMVTFCETIGTSNDIWSVGHGELTNYLLAIENVQIDHNKIVNPLDNEPIWVRLSSGIEKLSPGESITIKQ